MTEHFSTIHERETIDDKGEKCNYPNAQKTQLLRSYNKTNESLTKILEAPGTLQNNIIADSFKHIFYPDQTAVSQCLNSANWLMNGNRNSEKSVQVQLLT